MTVRKIMNAGSHPCFFAPPPPCKIGVLGQNKRTFFGQKVDNDNTQYWLSPKKVAHRILGAMLGK